MVISEDNKTSLLGDDLASQLENAAKSSDPVSQMPHPIAPESSQALDPALFGHEEVNKVEEEARTAQQAEATKQTEVKPRNPTTPSFDFLDDSKTPLTPEVKTEVKSYNTPFYYAVLGIVLCGITAIGAGFFNWYLQAKSLPNTETPNEYVQATSDYYNEYGQLLGLFDLESHRGTDFTNDGKNKVKSLISANGLNYPQKKDLIQSSSSDFGQKTIELKKEIKTITDQLNKDGFFPEELVTILKENNSVSSIQRSLLSLEIVKFSSAMKVFSLMDVFLTSLSNELSMPKSEIKQKLNDLLARGENDVKNYLNYCYNNPYEPANCSIIGDFDTYYRLSKSKENFDTGFFKTMMDMIDRKLENAQLPSFAITFNDFDSKSGEISFSVEVNTLKEDEYALIREGIKNPHIFIVSELVKLLKQSTFILGKSIDVKEMQVSEKEEELGGTTYKYHTSSKTFTLPIQKNTQREIFDYVDSYKTLLDEQEEESDNRSESLLDAVVDGIWSFFDGDSQNTTGGFISKDLSQDGENSQKKEQKSDSKGSITETRQTSWSVSAISGSKATSKTTKTGSGDIKTKISDSAVNQANNHN